MGNSMSVKTPDHIVNAVVEEYKQGYCLIADLARKYNVSSSSVLRFLKSKNVPTDHNRRWKHIIVSNTNIDVIPENRFRCSPNEIISSNNKEDTSENLAQSVERLVRKQARSLILQMLAEIESKDSKSD